MTDSLPPGAAQRISSENARIRERRSEIWRIVVAVLAIALLAALVWVVWRAQEDRDQAVGNSQTLAEQVLSACRSGGQAEAQLEAIGACSTAGEVSENPTEATQPASVDESQVRRVVDQYLRDNPPASGRPPTDAEVDSAVVRVCERIDCTGPAGDAGQDGETGESGRDGEPAPPPTDEQVLAVVAAFCGPSACRPTPEEVQQAVTDYCASMGEPCRGLPGGMPDSYVRVDHDDLLGDVRWVCTRITAADQQPPEYTCERE